MFRAITMQTRASTLLPLLLGLSGGLPLPGANAVSATPTITIAEPIILQDAGSGLYQGGPLLYLKDGSLLFGGLEQSLRSIDHGKTWSKQPRLILSSGMTLECRDGSFFSLAGPARQGGKPGEFLMKGFRLNSPVELPGQAPPIGYDVQLTLTQWAPSTGDDGKFEQTAPGIGGPMIELADGTLLVATYGNFVGDLVPIEGFVATKGEKWFRYRTYLLASTDRGASWKYRATIAYDGKSGQESFCEPGLVDLGNGELLAVMRTGRCAPMYLARSTDRGMTWGKPESLHTLGLAPNLALLPNGTLVCSSGWRPAKNEVVGGGQPAQIALEDYRRRYQSEVGISDPSAAAGDYVMFSRDKGHTWTKPRRIALPITIGYTWLAPSGTDSCVVFSQRIVIPGESESSVASKYMTDWARWRSKARRVLEARLITVKP